MRKNILLASLFAASAVVSTSAMADVHFDFTVPFNITKIANSSTMTGVASSLMIDVDSGTALGLYGESWTYSDTSTVPATASTMTVSTFRFQKAVTDVVNVGVDLGTVDTTGVAAATGNVADVFGNAKILSTKGKINSYLSTELKYRLARTNGAAGTANNLGGVQFGLGAGLNF